MPVVETDTLSRPRHNDDQNAYWARPASQLLTELAADAGGLTSSDARQRLNNAGPNSIGKNGSVNALVTLARQFRNPLVLILIFAAIASAAVGDISDAVIIGVIVLASCILSFSQEYRASRTMESLREALSIKASVLRDGNEVDIAVDQIVPGDILKLSAGNMIPVDGIILDSRDFNVSEAALTGETFPVVKSAGQSGKDATLAQRSNVVFTGTSVRSGVATVLAIKTGAGTEFAGIAEAIRRQAPETEFAKGIRHFGALMTEVMLAIVIVVFVTNLLLHRPLIESLLFSLALAVGLTPELLPAIISMTLASGARVMAKNGVVVRKLESIENLGSMDILCTDKTGTLTEGVIHLDGCFDSKGQVSADVKLWSTLNATLQTGLANPLDVAIAANAGDEDLSPYSKIDEIPYDFIRKRLTVVVRHAADATSDLMICKGAVSNVLEICSTILTEKGSAMLDDARRQDIDKSFRAWSEEGFRVLGVAIRRPDRKPAYRREDETDFAFAGFLLFLDPAKAGVSETLAELTTRGIKIKVITGDNRYVARHLAAAVGINVRRVMTGEELSRMTKDALFGLAPRTDLFVEIDPNQKERIIEALRRHGHVVGYMGDGINDAPALHEADVGISVDHAADVAREAADIILLNQDLTVLLRGIDDGRRTFANTMKYISITTSANFGNMISMALASFFLPFLPLLATQILLNNLLSSVPSLAIAGDNVDAELVQRPRRWDIGSVRRFMVSFGLVSSAFDLLTFGFLVLVMNADAGRFRTGWFVESLLTQLAIILVVRTQQVVWRSRPSRLLSGLTVAVAIIAVTLPYLPDADWLGFVALPLPMLAGLVAVSAVYVAVSEGTKRWFFARERKLHHQRSPKFLRPSWI